MINIKDIVNETIVDPRSVASKILKLNLGNFNIVQAGVFVAICSTILTYIFLRILAGNISDDNLSENLVLDELLTYMTGIQPIYFTANQILQMLLFASIITLGGKLFNGSGKFFEAFICIIWVEFILLIIKLLQIILLPFSLIFSFLVLVPGVLWSLWAFASMAAAIHGFHSTLLTLCGGLGLSLLVFTILNILF